MCVYTYDVCTLTYVDMHSGVHIQTPEMGLEYPSIPLIQNLPLTWRYVGDQYAPVIPLSPPYNTGVTDTNATTHSNLIQTQVLKFAQYTLLPT